MKKRIKKIFLLLFLAGVLLFPFSGFLFAGTDLELEYPDVEGVVVPRTIKAFLPEYINYLFRFAVGIAGLIAFASLLYGGFRYVASAGSPVATAEARAQITASILGLLLLLGSYLLLTSINPQLTILSTRNITVEKGVILYTADDCPGGADPGGSKLGLEEGKDFLRLRRSSSTLRGIRKEDYSREVKSIWFLNDNTVLEITIYDKEDFDESGNSVKLDWLDAGECMHIGPPLVATEVRSIRLKWKFPGVYLYAGTDCTGTDQFPEPMAFNGDTATFDDDNFHDKAQSYKILPWVKTELVWNVGLKSECGKIFDYPNLCADKPDCCEKKHTVIGKHGFILHEKSNFEGDAEVFFGGEIEEYPPRCYNLPNESRGGDRSPPICEWIDPWPGPYCLEHVNHPDELRASAITIFRQIMPDEEVSGDGVTLYANYDFDSEGGKDELDPCVSRPTTYPEWFDKDNCKILKEKKGSSIRVDGNFIAVLFIQDGGGEVFKKSDLRLKDNYIGDDNVVRMLTIPISPNTGAP